jgi:hypothetical protein
MIGGAINWGVIPADVLAEIRNQQLQSKNLLFLFKILTKKT